MDFQWYTSVSGVVAATIVLVEIIKRFLGNISGFMAIPTWIYAVAVAAVLTYLSNAIWRTLPGDRMDLMMQAVMTAALASGFKEWFMNAGKPVSESAVAVRARIRRAARVTWPSLPTLANERGWQATIGKGKKGDPPCDD